jgi:hypothetical protein
MLTLIGLARNSVVAYVISFVHNRQVFHLTNSGQKRKQHIGELEDITTKIITLL